MMRVYIAGPLSTDGKYGAICRNVRAAIDAADKVMGWGAAPFCPHLSHFWNLIHYHEWKEWMHLDRAFVEVCDAMWRLPGESVGANLEEQWARELGIPVYNCERDIKAAVFKVLYYKDL